MSSLAQESPLLQNRYTNTPRSRHGSFHKGMARDISTWEMPEGYCYDAVDWLCDFPGKIRKRGGTTSPAAGNSTATVENLASFKSNGVDGITGIVGSSGKSGAITLFNTSTGATTALQASLPAATFACRPFQHRNLIVLPMQMLGTTTNDTNKMYFWGGGTAASVTSVSGTVTAFDNRVTGIGTSMTAAMLGSIVALYDGSSLFYFGRIVEVTSSSAIRVEPTPTVSFSFGAAAPFSRVSPVYSPASLNDNGLIGGDADVTGRFGVSFQGRIVLGDTVYQNTANAAGINRKPRRIWWSKLATEALMFPATATTSDGEAVLSPGAFTWTPNPTGATTNVPLFNWVDIDGLQSMTGLAAVGDGTLLIFGPQQMYRLTGQLSTETTAIPDFSFSVDQVSNNVGCIAARSIQYARNGLIFAGLDNIYVYDGSSLKPILDGYNARYYQDRLRNGDRPVGSLYAGNRNHYYLSMNGSDTSGLMIDLTTNALTRITNVQLFDSVPDPVDATEAWGARWWDVTSAAPTMTKGQLIRLDPIWLPAQANASDADGTAVLADYQSAALDSEPLAINKIPADIQLSYDLRGTGSPTATVKMDTKLNTQDASFATVTSSLANTGSVALTKNITPAVPVVAEGPAVEFRFTMNAAAASCELLGIDFGVQERPGMFST